MAEKIKMDELPKKALAAVQSFFEEEEAATENIFIKTDTDYWWYQRFTSGPSSYFFTVWDGQVWDEPYTVPDEVMLVS